MIRGARVDDRLGSLMLSGDLDADGAADIVTSGYGGTPDNGEAWLFSGAALATGGNFSTADAVASVHGDAENDQLGAGGLLVPDADGDGSPDVLLTRRAGSTCDLLYFPSSALLGSLGAGDAGASLSGPEYGSAWPLAVLNGGAAREASEASAVLGVEGWDDPEVDSGRVYLAPMALVVTGGAVTDATTWITGTRGSLLGTSAVAGDVDGDGVDDLILDAGSDRLGAGALYLFLGATLASGGGFVVGDADGDVGSRAPDAGIGIFSTLAPDIDMDGLPDLAVVGAGAGDAGKVWVLSGSVLSGTALAEDQAFASVLGSGQDRLGGRVLAVGDVDGDGISDLGLANTGTVGGYEDGGRAYVYAGSALTGGASLDVLEGAAAVFTSEQDEQTLGSDLAAAGDIDGDGRDDLFLGASGDSWSLSHTGAVYVLISTL